MKPITIPTFNEFVELIRGNGFDVPVATSGPEQSGKSTFSMLCSINKLGFTGENTEEFRKFLEKNCIFNPADIWKIRKLPADAEVPVDEAIRVAWRREFYRPENRWLIKLYRQFGRFKRVYYLNIPKFWSLDEELLSDRIKVWVHIIKKDVKKVNGQPMPQMFHAIVFQKDYHAYQDDPWMRRQCRKLLKDDNKRHGVVGIIPHDIAKVVRRYINMPSFYAYIRFKPMEQPLWNVYDQYSLEKKLSYEKREGDEVDKWKFRLYTMVYNMKERGLAAKQINELLTVDGIPIVDESWISRKWDDIVDLATSGSSKELKGIRHMNKLKKREADENSEGS